MTQIRQPRKRRSTIENLPQLRAFLMGASPIKMRVGLDAASRYLLGVLSTEDGLTESTWFTQLGYRLTKEKRLSTQINDYAASDYYDLPKSPPTPTQPFTIPEQLKEVIVQTADTGPFKDKRGVTSIWLRAAICYIAFVERQIDRSTLPSHLYSAAL